MEAIYPVFPVFHWPNFRERVAKREFLVDRNLFASVMGACALVRAQEPHSAGHVPSNSSHHEQDRLTESFFLAASDAIPRDPSSAHGLHYLRASGLLAWAALHHGHIAVMQEYLGRFWTLSWAAHFADESKWPQNITLTEKEEYRRLFWSVYTLDLLAVIVYGKTTSVEDANVHVEYPTQTDDAHITDSSYISNDEPSWLQGWNFVLDLTRALAHDVIQHRRSHGTVYNSGRSWLRSRAFEPPNADNVVVSAIAWYHRMPLQFKSNVTQATTANLEAHLFNVQAVRIQFAIQLLCATVCFSDNGLDIHRKFDNAEELLSFMHGVNDRLSQAAMLPFAHFYAAVFRQFVNDLGPLITTNLRERARSIIETMRVHLRNSEPLCYGAASLLRDLQSSLRRLDLVSHGQD